MHRPIEAYNCTTELLTVKKLFSRKIYSILFFVNQYRFGQPEDIGGIVSFLCSDDASYITGENIVVSGGMPSRL